MTWNNYQYSLSCFQPANLTLTTRIAAFDLDGTLIRTRSNKRFAVDANDWELFHPFKVQDHLNRLHSDGYTLVIISNQLGVSKGKVDLGEIQNKVVSMAKEVGLPFVFMLATNNDHYRKPRVGSWECLEQLVGTPIDKEHSFYCGDAAGRPSDFAASDYQFAMNIGIAFQTPEQLFLGQPQSLQTMWSFDPRLLRSSQSSNPDINRTLHTLLVEIVLLVGPPASGKSYLASQLSGEYVVLSQDDLGTLAKCKKACCAALGAGAKVLIDSTNRNMKTRATWVDIAQAYKVPIRCVVIQIDKPLAMHMNMYRSVYGDKKIPAVAIHCYYRAFEPPSIGEGFVQVIPWTFQLDLESMSTLQISRASAFL